MAEVVAWGALVLVMLIAVAFAWASYRRHTRRARARSLAALNRLLAEADELSRRDQDPPSTAD